MKTLTDIIYQYEDMKFSYENHWHCSIFCAMVIEEYTGKKIPGWREKAKKINDWPSAKKTLHSLGGDSIKDVPSIFLGADKKKDISEVKLGEPVCYINEEGEEILGICNGQRAYFLTESEGLTARNIEDCECCWSIK